MKNKSAIKPFWVVIPAAGIGKRMQSAIPKQYLTLGHLTVIEHTLNCFLSFPELLGIVVCLSATDNYWTKLAISKDSIIQMVKGGKERAHSVLAGLQLLAKQAQFDDWVLVHDAARPNLQLSDLEKLLIKVQQDEIGGLLAVPARDTLKQADLSGRVIKTLNRSSVWHALTPQAFRLGILQQALEQALQANQMITDEASAMELAGYTPLLVEGRSDNIKITRPEDIEWLAPYFTYG